MILWLAACHDPNEDVPTDEPIAWEACPLFFEGKERPPAQCATVEVPLEWDDPDGETIELFVQRRLGEARTRDRQLWMLAGGPGQPGSVFETYIRDLGRADPTTDWYTLDHRGVGRSTRLGCPDQEADDSDGGIDVTAAEWPDCLAAVEAEWGDGLQRFTTTAAARDLERLIGLTEADQDVFVYGGSYGTTLGHRFLQVFPDRVDGVVLDSVAIDVDHRVYDEEFDAVGRAFLDEVCADDDRCREELGDDPSAYAAEVMDRVEQGHCGEGPLDADGLKGALGVFVADASLRGYAPALIQRYDRCTEDDVADLDRLYTLFVDRAPHYTERQNSPVLFANIELSEQWPEPFPDEADLQQVVDDAIFSFAVGPDQRPLLDIWPRYPHDEHWGGLATTSTPILFLQGGMDPQTPLARAEPVFDAFTAPGQHAVVFPEGTHILLGATPANGEDCATRLLLDFLDDPTAAPDRSCVDDVDPVKFEGQGLQNKLLLTDWDRWGDGGCGCASGTGAPATIWGALVALAMARRRRCGTG